MYVDVVVVHSTFGRVKKGYIGYNSMCMEVSALRLAEGTVSLGVKKKWVQSERLSW